MTEREKWRREILVAGAVLVVFLLLYPPWAWEVTSEGARITRGLGHHWVWEKDNKGNIFDYGRLGVEIGAVAALTGALFFALKEK
jgi:hypothetical protein